MRDIVMSELLVSALLMLVLVRPVFKPLKSVSALAILPFIAFFVCIFIFIGHGIFLPVCFLTVFASILCFVEFGRLIALVQHMRNDTYSKGAVVFRLVLLVFLSGFLFLLYRFPHSAPYHTEKPIRCKSVTLSAPENGGAELPVRLVCSEAAGTADTAGSGNRGNRIASADGMQHVQPLVAGSSSGTAADDVLILVAADSSGADDTAGTVARVAAGKGYTVIEILPAKQPFSLPRFWLYKELIPLIGKNTGRYLKKIPDEKEAGVFSACLEKTVQQYGNAKRIYVYADGRYTDLTAEYAIQNSDIFSGVFFSLSEEEPLPSAPDGWAVLSTAGAVKTEKERHAPFFFYIQPHENLTGFASLAADDPLAVLLLGVPAEKVLHSRQTEVHTAELFCSWLSEKK